MGRLRVLPALIFCMGTLASAADIQPELRSLLQEYTFLNTQSWCMLYRTGDYPALENMDEELFQKLGASGLFSFPMSRERTQDLWKKAGWGDAPHWILVQGYELIAEGAQPPKAKDILESMRGKGFRPEWEYVDAFLRDYPDHGDARLAKLHWEVDLAYFRWENPRLKVRYGESVWEGWIRELQILKGFSELPPRRYTRTFALLPHWLDPMPPAVAESMLPLLRKVGEILRRDPYIPGLWMVFRMWLEKIPQGEALFQEWLESYQPPPGEPPFPFRAVHPFYRLCRAQGRWEEGAQKLKAWADAPRDKLEEDPLLLGKQSEERAEALVLAASLLAQAGRHDEGESLLAEAYGLAGPQWSALVQGFKALPQAQAYPGYAPWLDKPGKAHPAFPLQRSSPARQVERLSEFLRKDPHNTHARRLRVDWLQKIPPSSRDERGGPPAPLGRSASPSCSPRYESMLSEDLHLGGFRPPKLDPSFLKSPVWAERSLKALPELEDQLRHWPGDPTLWHQWLFWASHHPKKPKAVTLYKSLPPWSPPKEWLFSLPLVAVAAVAGELQAQARWDELREWCEPHWVQLKRNASSNESLDPDFLQRSLDAFIQPLLVALRQLRRGPELREIEKQVQIWKTIGHNEQKK